MKKISIVDYGLGNLFSVKQALEFCSDDNKKHIVITSSPSEIQDSDYLILPGVGAFKNAMDAIKGRELDKEIKNFALSGKPLMGICLGMQILATSSDEFGMHDGLNLIPGKVSYIGETNLNGSIRKVPSIGWKDLEASLNSNKSSNLLTTHKNASVYFVHSYHFLQENEDHLIASYNYGDTAISAAVQKENIIGFQFHPEKSSHHGLKILSSFLDM